jgi:uncharacterized membrane protein YhaH (DUF805 family)
MLFSFEGRLRRRDFWLCEIALWFAGWVLGSIAGAAFLPHMMVGPNFSHGWAYGWPMASGFWGVYSLVALLLLWPHLAVGIKRCHDRNQTGLWMLLLLVPVIGWFWWLINLGLLDGTPGPNQYGPSPKGIGGAEPAAA